MTCSSPCFNRNDPSGKNTCSITPDSTSAFNAKNNTYAIVDGNGYPIQSFSMKLGYSESTVQNLVGCIPNSLGKGSGSCYDDSGNIISGYKACTETECKPVIYDNSFPLNQCNYAYVTIEGNYQPLASCTNDHSTACTEPLCDPPCQNGGICELNASLQPVCNCNSASITLKDCYGFYGGEDGETFNNGPNSQNFTIRFTGDQCQNVPGLPDGFVTDFKSKAHGQCFSNHPANLTGTNPPCQNYHIECVNTDTMYAANVCAENQEIDNTCGGYY